MEAGNRVIDVVIAVLIFASVLAGVIAFVALTLGLMSALLWLFVGDVIEELSKDVWR